MKSLEILGLAAIGLLGLTILGKAPEGSQTINVSSDGGGGSDGLSELLNIQQNSFQSVVDSLTANYEQTLADNNSVFDTALSSIHDTIQENNEKFNLDLSGLEQKISDLNLENLDLEEQLRNAVDGVKEKVTSSINSIIPETTFDFHFAWWDTGIDLPNIYGLMSQAGVSSITRLKNLGFGGL